MKWTLFFEKKNKTFLYLSVFLTPLFFLPFSQNFLDYPKFFLFSLFISFSFLCWLGRQIFQEKLILRKSKHLYLALFCIFFSTLLSTSFSFNFRLSFFGQPLEIIDNFVCLTLFLIFTFLLINSFNKKIEFIILTSLLLLSFGLVALFNLFQLFHLFPLPFDFSKAPSFNLVGTPNSLALSFSFLLPLSLSFFFKSQKGLKTIFALLSFLFFLNIFFINFKTAWFALILESIIVLIFGLKEKIKKEIPLIFMPLLIISIFFYFSPFSFPLFPPLENEISPSFLAEIIIIKESLSKKIKNLFFGTGPGSFSFNYSLYRPAEINETQYWGRRFFRGHSLFLDWFLTKGFLGAFSLLFLILFSLFYVLFFLSKLNEKDDLFENKLALGTSLVGIAASLFFYPFNLVLFFLFWFFLGNVFFFEKEKEINISSPSRSLLINSVFVFTLVLIFTLLFFQTKNYLAEIYYFQGVKNFQRNNLDSALQSVQKAIKLNPSLDIYWRDLSQIYLAKANLVSNDSTITSEEKRALLNKLIIEGANAINTAINISPQNVANWNVRGFFFQNLIGLEGAPQVALDSYHQAIQLEPNSPYPYTEKGRAYILMAQELMKKGEIESQKEYLQSAISILERAIQLKKDYAPAHYLLAIAYDQLGESQKAISKLEETKVLVSNDVGLMFQLGVLYWRRGELEKAKKECEKILTINPEYSNAHYLLGLVYEKMGKREEAIKEFEVLEKQNHENEEIKKILENLKKGLPPLEEPPSELPTEIKKSSPEIRE